jgi:hypothetical protein
MTRLFVLILFSRVHSVVYAFNLEFLAGNLERYFSSTLLTNRVYIQIFANTQPSAVPSTSSIVQQPQPTQQTLHLVNLHQFL